MRAYMRERRATQRAERLAANDGAGGPGAPSRARSTEGTEGQEEYTESCSGYAGGWLWLGGIAVVVVGIACVRWRNSAPERAEAVNTGG